MNYPDLFSEIKIAGHRLKNRVAMSPLFVGYARPDGTPSELTLEHYKKIAEGGAGMIVVEIAAVNDDQSKMGRMLKAYEKSHIKPFSRLANVIKERGIVAVQQIVHQGRLNLSKPLAPSVVPIFGIDPVEMTLDDINNAKADYVNSADIVKQAGYDMVELHGGTGYLLAQFLSPRTNLRTDRYGGNPEKRMTFGLEVIDSIKKKLGSDYPIGYRIMADEYIEGGTTIDISAPYSKKLEETGIAYLNVMSGTYESFMLPEILEISAQEGYIIPLAEEIKKQVNIPVMASGRILKPSMAENLISEKNIDIIGIGRGLLSDPQWPIKAKEGRESEINHCINCNSCLVNVQSKEPVVCSQWDDVQTNRIAELYEDDG